MPRGQRARVLYLSHGGGPLPLLGDPAHREMIDNLVAIAANINRPKAIIVISAHWEEDVPTITSGAMPSLIYDYYGFPKQAYDVRYPAPGEPQLAERMAAMLDKQGVACRLDDERGFDHGLFVPLKVMYPAADIPCIQMSLLDSLSPDDHINIGKALVELKKDNLLIIGSGFSFHNMKAFADTTSTDIRDKNRAFESWLIETCSNRKLDENERTERLLEWESAPHARFCHPREEHLLPLHVCYGITQARCKEHYELTIMGKRASVYLW